MSLPDSYQTLIHEVTASLAPLRRGIPDVTRAFGQLAQSAAKDGALSAKTKELIALALGVAARCDDCIAFHLQALVRLGVTLQELEETLGMTVYMGGGPSLMYAAHAMAAYAELSAPAPAAASPGG